MCLYSGLFRVKLLESGIWFGEVCGRSTHGYKHLPLEARVTSQLQYDVMSALLMTWWQRRAKQDYVWPAK